MAQGYPAEFRQRAVELARQGAQPVARIAADLGIAQSCLRRWVKHLPVTYRTLWCSGAFTP